MREGGRRNKGMFLWECYIRGLFGFGFALCMLCMLWNVVECCGKKEKRKKEKTNKQTNKQINKQTNKGSFIRVLLLIDILLGFDDCFFKVNFEYLKLFYLR